MAPYRGNLGNLLQHWVLCEILNIGARHGTHVGFVDAYSMAPLATERLMPDATSDLFDRVRERLPGEKTPYEVAWKDLASQGSGYPNSAAFLVSLWPCRFSLVLCELDPAPAQQLQGWAKSLRILPNCANVDVFDGDWRQRFRQGIALPGDFLFVSFDPYMFDSNGPGRNAKPGNMYPRDLDLLAEAVTSVSQGVVVQLSTYSANNNNPQDAVIRTVSSRVGPAKLEMVSVVRASGNMMSMVLARNLGWADSLRELSSRFKSWLSRI